MNASEHDGSVAIIGVAGRFPDAGDVETLWSNLQAGRQAIRPLTDGELAAVDPARRRNPRYVAVTAPVADVEHWDAAFFGFTRPEAELIDPQHRLFLECAWQGLEDAGYDPRRCPGVVGVFGGSHFPTYLLNNLSGHRQLLEELGHQRVGIANERDMLTTMVSYKLDLRGPSAAVQTACSTSMVAIHLACQSLLSQEADVMLAGGVALHIPQSEGYLHEQGGLFSRDGVFRSLDAKASGRVVGNGVGMVVLKRTEDAVRDNDHIYATIIGSAMNNDGIGRAGFAAPGLRGQAEVMIEALSCAGVDPGDISYVEAHGTGTVLGDSVELDALSRTLSTDSAAGTCAVGSIKANIGHLDRASGVTAVIKTALMLRDERIPPQINYETPNPHLDVASARFRIHTEATEWPRGATPRRALVNSFGMGGTNAAAILQEAPPIDDDERAASGPHLLVLSARTPAALDAAGERLHGHLHRHPELELADVAYTLQVGRTPFNHRRIIVCADRESALTALADPASPSVRTSADSSCKPELSLVIADGPGLHPAQARMLYDVEPVFRTAFQRVAGEARGDAWREPAYGAAFRFALGSLLMSWGLRPSRIEGAGVGALVAACLNGTLEPDALRRCDVACDRPAAPAGGSSAGGIVIELGAAGPNSAAHGRTEEPPRRLPAAFTLAAGEHPLVALLDLAGRLWLAAVDIDWTGLHAGRRRRRVPLPTYPFERRRFWIDPVKRCDEPATRPMRSEPACNV
ncbi:MAG: beta-ketoacyl synthase N-terminal-like domain-containing protein [Solirubrobacteraceae bacterium]